jgi:sugar-specific transcriptional regulator TrmB
MVSENDLEHAGLKGKNATVYLALLQLGTASAYEISVATGIKRPTTYDILSELSSSGLVTMNDTGKKRHYTVGDPRNLKRQPEKQLSVIDTILPELKALYNEGERKPHIRYFEGIEGLTFIHEELLKVESGVYYYFDAGMKMLDLLGAAYLKKFVARRLERNIWSYSIRVKEAEVDIPYLLSSTDYRRSVRYFPHPVDPNFTSIYIYDGCVGLASSKKESYALIIESHEFHRSMKTIWDIVWQIAEPAENG